MKRPINHNCFQLVFENAYDAFLLACPEGHIYHANAVACEMFQRTYDEMLTLNWGDLVDSDEPGTLEALKKRFRSEKTRSILRLKRKDGTLFEGDFSSSFFKDDGNEHWILFVIRDITLFVETERRLKEAEALATQLATHDYLTGLLNRRGFMEFLNHELERAKRMGTPTGLIMMDIDHFKQMNDRYGHTGGDWLLKYIADFVSENLRDYDVLARFAGDEFILLLPETSWEESFTIAERLRLNVEERKITYMGSMLRITVSLGVICIPAQYENSIDDLISRVDNALYTAKSTRNTVFFLPANK